MGEIKAMKSIAIPLAATFALAACNQASAPADADSVMDEINKAEAYQVSAFASDNLDAVVGVYGEDAVFSASGMASRHGKAEIRDTFEKMLADPAAALEVQNGTSWVSSSGDLAGTTATYKYSYTDPATGKVVSDKGTNTSVWQKHADGWKLMADANISEPPAEGEETPAT